MGKVVVVDDEEVMLSLLQAIIEEQGHAVFTALNGQEALELIKREKPQLVLSDVMMPIMDGYTLLKHIRQEPAWNHIKVILISAAPIKKNGQYQADAYVSKPYDLQILDEIIEQYLT